MASRRAYVREELSAGPRPDPGLARRPKPRQLVLPQLTQVTTMKARPKKSKKSDVNASKGKRYSADERAKILAVVHEVNAKRGRGGVTAAAAKFGVSPLTISHWLRNVGILGAPGARRRSA